MDDKLKKKVLRMFSYGIYILTSKFKDNCSAATVTWVSQASFEPPLVSVCIKRDSMSYKVVKERGEFLLHILGEDQEDLATAFFKQTTLEKGFINKQPYQLMDNLPLLVSASAYLKCRALEIMENGDHPLFLSEVIDAVVQKESKPLELRSTDGKYGG